MKFRVFLAAVCCIALSNAHGQSTTSTPPPPPIYSFVERMPSAGYSVPEYIGANLNYPKKAQKDGISGRVIVRFVVSEAGNIEDVVVTKGIGGGCDEEAARVVREMPKWSPGTQEGKPVKVYFNLPIVFNLK